MRTNTYLFLCAVIFSKNGGRNGCAFTDVLQTKKNANMLYKTEHKETQSTQKMSQSLSKNDLVKATMSQRHSNCYGFVKTGFE